MIERRLVQSARERHRTKVLHLQVTAVHKANIMKIADGYFLKVCSDVAVDYPAIEFENMIVDNASMQVRASFFYL